MLSTSMPNISGPNDPSMPRRNSSPPDLAATSKNCCGMYLLINYLHRWWNMVFNEYSLFEIHQYHEHTLLHNSIHNRNIIFSHSVRIIKYFRRNPPRLCLTVSLGKEFWCDRCIVSPSWNSHYILIFVYVTNIFLWN